MEQEILQVLSKHGSTGLDELVTRFPGVGWSPVFLAVDRLSRSGHVMLELAGRGQYRIIPLAPILD
jgi:hypothetical protein